MQKLAGDLLLGSELVKVSILQTVNPHFLRSANDLRTGITEVMGSNPVEASDFFFWAFFVTA